jgi:hypothetical protein
MKKCQNFKRNPLLFSPLTRYTDTAIKCIDEQPPVYLYEPRVRKRKKLITATEIYEGKILENAI